jgi:hypothetical protein
MAATANGEVVKSPGTFVLSTYCTCPDVSLTITPDFKLPNGEKPNGVNGGGTEQKLKLKNRNFLFRFFEILLIYII